MNNIGYATQVLLFDITVGAIIAVSALFILLLVYV